MTIVLECSSADTGVGATIAPSSQLWNGICADLANAASARSAIGVMARAAMMAVRDSAPFDLAAIAASVSAKPPIRFSKIARAAFFFASGVPSWLISMNEQRVVNSQNRLNHVI